MPMTDKLRLALLGFDYGHQSGYGGALAANLGVELAGVIRCACDTPLSVERGRAFARDRQVPYYDDFEAGLSAVKPHLVSVALPPADNAKVVLALVGRGIHVLCEKPVSLDKTEVVKIKEAMKKSGAQFSFAVASALFTRPIYEAVEIARSGILGVIRVLNYQYLQPKGPVYAGRTKTTGGEFANFALYGWIPVSSIANAPLASVFSMQRALFYDRYKKEGIDDLSVTSVRFTNGVTAAFTIGRVPVKSMPVTDIRLEIIGSEGALNVRNGLGDAAWVYEDFHGNDADFERGGFNKIVYNEPAVRMQTDDVVAAIRAGIRPAITIDHMISFSEFFDAAERSSAERKVIRL